MFIDLVYESMLKNGKWCQRWKCKFKYPFPHYSRKKNTAEERLDSSDAREDSRKKIKVWLRGRENTVWL